MSRTLWISCWLTPNKIKLKIDQILLETTIDQILFRRPRTSYYTWTQNANRNVQTIILHSNPEEKEMLKRAKEIPEKTIDKEDKE